MGDVKTEVKIVIVENNINTLNQQIYDRVIACRVGKMAKDEKMVTSATDVLITLEKMVDEYNEILKELKAELKNELPKQCNTGQAEKK